MARYCTTYCTAVALYVYVDIDVNKEIEGTLSNSEPEPLFQFALSARSRQWAEASCPSRLRGFVT
jgi:hypothetical protein